VKPSAVRPAAERLEQVQQHLVGAVAGPHLVGRDGNTAGAAEIGRQVLAQAENSRSG
jgi:hypothetical protein